MTTQPTKMMCATGSFGIYNGVNGGVQNVWLCGCRNLPGPDGRPQTGTVQGICAHATRDEARACPRRPK